MEQPTNQEIARELYQIAELLDRLEENPFRIRAYQAAARKIESLKQPLAELIEHGQTAKLTHYSGIGKRIANLIEEFVKRGRTQYHEQLLSEVSPEQILQKVPGIGPELAQRIVDELNITTLEELEQAAHNGRLGEVQGFGTGRLRTVKASLAGILSSYAQRRMRQLAAKEKPDAEHPGVDILLDVDQEYRRKQATGQLKKIAPKRFNPRHEAWLPILHTQRGDWQFTVLFSNTARAHNLGKTRDWVVIYFAREGQEGQATVVTKEQGELQGKRVVRGREEECRKYYEKR